MISEISPSSVPVHHLLPLRISGWTCVHCVDARLACRWLREIRASEEVYEFFSTSRKLNCFVFISLQNLCSFTVLVFSSQAVQILGIPYRSFLMKAPIYCVYVLQTVHSALYRCGPSYISDILSFSNRLTWSIPPVHYAQKKATTILRSLLSTLVAVCSP